jgi:hypothetical protein
MFSQIKLRAISSFPFKVYTTNICLVVGYLPLLYRKFFDKAIEGTWISNDKTENIVYQDITNTPGYIHIDSNNNTHDKIGMTYIYYTSSLVIGD